MDVPQHGYPRVSLTVLMLLVAFSILAAVYVTIDWQLARRH